MVTEDPKVLLQDFPEISDDDHSPVSGQSAVHFTKSESYIDLNNFDFSKKVTDPYAKEDDEGEEFCDEYSEIFSSNGHRLGGYPFFNQTDPREYNKLIQYYVLLLQIDKDDTDGIEIMWGIQAWVTSLFILTI